MLHHEIISNDGTLTSNECTSGSAVTPHFLRSTSPMLRVISSTPLTRGRPTLLHDIRPLHCSMRSRSFVDSGSWSSVNCSADALRQSNARLSPTCATANSALFLMTHTVAVLPLDCEDGTRQSDELVCPTCNLSFWLCLPVASNTAYWQLKITSSANQEKIQLMFYFTILNYYITITKMVGIIGMDHLWPQ